MRYIVTGSTGYLGRIFIDEMFDQGLTPIKLLVRSAEAKEIFKDYDLDIAIGNLLDEEFLKKEIKEGDVVFHLAGMIDIVEGNKDLIYKVNVDATKLIADVCLEKKVNKLIYVSSSSAIDVSKSKRSLIREPDKFTPDNLIGDYAKTKAIASGYVLELANKNGLNAVVVLPSLIVGPRDYRLSQIGDLLVKYYGKRYSAFINGRYNFVDVRDVAMGLVGAYRHGRVGHSYLLTGECLSIKKMFDLFRTLTPGTKRHLWVPTSLIYLVMPIINIYYKRKKINPLFTKTSLKIIKQNSNFSNAKAKRDLNFEARSIHLSFIDMLNWFINEKPELLKK